MVSLWYWFIRMTVRNLVPINFLLRNSVHNSNITQLLLCVGFWHLAELGSFSTYQDELNKTAILWIKVVPWETSDSGKGICSKEWTLHCRFKLHVWHIVKKLLLGKWALFSWFSPWPAEYPQWDVILIVQTQYTQCANSSLVPPNAYLTLDSRCGHLPIAQLLPQTQSHR